jgi:pyruvate dehydrogenase E1 component alpha subunit
MNDPALSKWHPPTREHGLALLTDMTRIRRLEERSAERYSAGSIRGFLHLYIGEEAIATGVSHALGAEDNVVATYREHGHALLRGVSAAAIMAEMYGKSEGCCRGRGGSMHLFSREHRFFGGHAIVGGSLPVAVGLALASKMQKQATVTVCFFGDGAVAEGEFHESLNLAALWQLPVLFVCENNLYAMGTALARAQSETDLALKARSYEIPSESVDGMDVLAVERAARHALVAIRAGEGPYFLECRSYRFRAHSMFDAELYRTKEEVEQWRRRDPIASLVAALRSYDLVTEADVARIEAAVAEEMDAAIAVAERGTLEPVADLLRDVYASREEP